jgi:catechol 2,3-dioxygenase-like lactoylglutathione lyase family enzyme
MTVKKLTPNLYTDDVDACVKFWVERMHFEKTVEVPDGEGLAFAALQSGGIELMYGSWASLEKEPGVAGSYQRGTGFLFIEVDDLDAVLEAMEGVPMVLPVHKTFYGATEFSVKDPAGHLITFAHFAAQ